MVFVASKKKDRVPERDKTETPQTRQRFLYLNLPKPSQRKTKNMANVLHTLALECLLIRQAVTCICTETGTHSMCIGTIIWEL